MSSPTLTATYKTHTTTHETTTSAVDDADINTNANTTAKTNDDSKSSHASEVKSFTYALLQQPQPQLQDSHHDATASKTAYLADLRAQVKLLQGDVNEFLTGKMEEDKLRAARGSSSGGGGGGGGASGVGVKGKGVEDVEEEENYGEERVDEED